MLPTGWRWTTFGAAADFFNGDRSDNYPSQSDRVVAGVPFINTGHIEPNGRLTRTGMDYITRAAFDRLRGGKVKQGDIVYCLRGSTIGKTARNHLVEGAIASSLVIVRARTNACQEYLYFYLTSPFGQQFVAQRDNGSAQPNLSVATLSEYPLLLPPIEEQRDIARTLGTLDDRIELNRRMSETLEGMARAFFKSWFVDFDPVRAKAEGRDTGLPKEIADLFPDSFEDSELGEIPSGWRAGPLGTFFTVGLGGAWGDDQESPKSNTAVRCLRGIDCHELAEGRIPDVPVRWLSPLQTAARKLSDGVILVEGSGSFCGRSLLWRQAYAGLIGEPVSYSNFCKRLDPLCSPAQAAICWLQMRRAFGSGELHAYRTGTAFPNFDIHGTLANLLVVVPDEEVSRVFARLFNAGQRLDLLNQSRTLGDLRDVLLPRLMAGPVMGKA